MPLLIVRNDITEMNVDVIVNTANPLPMVGSGVDSAIYKKAGWTELLNIRQKIGKLAVSNIAVTPALNLKAKYIVHVVGPRWRGGDAHEVELLTKCYQNVLEAATEYGCESIAIPLISTGNYDFPKELALQIAKETISQYLEANELKVYLVVYDRESFQFSKRLFDDVQSYIEQNLEQERFLKHSLSTRSLNGIEACVDSFDCCVAEEHKVCNNISSKELKYARRSLDDLVAEIDSTFAESLFKYIDDKGLTDPEVYKRANLDRKLFSKIRKNKNYKPSKNTALALAVALELNLDETKDFIGKAGYALTRSSKMDIIVEFFILQGNYDILELNEVLFYYEEPLLGSNVA
jgi:O-acetyl-ADP-ribose deacetylase (regulator of RNase III)